MSIFLSGVGIPLATFSYFLPIVTISGRRFLCSSIMTILLKLFVSSSFWSIKRWIVLSTWLPIVVRFSFAGAMCLWNFYISSNWWKRYTGCWSSTNNHNLFIFKRWFFVILVYIYGRVSCIVKCNFYCCCSWTYLKIMFLKIDNEGENRIGT